MKLNERKQKTLQLESGEGSVTFERNADGLKITLFDQRLHVEQLDHTDRHELAKWLIDDILSVNTEDRRASQTND